MTGRPSSLTGKIHGVDLVFTLALLCVFAISCVSVVLVGANVYEKTVEGMDENYNTRTSLVYLWEKVKQADTAGVIQLGEVEGSTALVLEQVFGENTYQTWIYPYKDTLRELMVPKDRSFLPEDGSVVMELSGITIEETDQGLLRFTVPDENGVPVSLLVKPRT